jgi:hypothetical protein
MGITIDAVGTIQLRSRQCDSLTGHRRPVHTATVLAPRSPEGRDHDHVNNGPRRDGRNEYRDQLYAEHGIAIELDGRLAHPGDARWDDIRRDNAAAAVGVTDAALRLDRGDDNSVPCRGRDREGTSQQGLRRSAAVFGRLSHRAAGRPYPARERAPQRANGRHVCCVTASWDSSEAA